MIRIVLAVALIMGFAGYFNYLVNVKQISVFIAPSVIITAICAVMYLCGLVNIMLFGLYTVIGVGIILVWYYRKSICFDEIRKNKFAVMLCVLLFIYLIYYTYSGVYVDGDTMTHWGVIVRSMCQDNRLPNFMNTEIAYQSYPPATACWSYFFLKVFGYGEGKALFAQGLWMLTCAIACFEFNKTKSKWGSMLAAVCVLFSLRWLDSLVVDVILALSVTAAAVGIYEYRSDIQKQLFVVLPFMLVIPMIKNSGILFVVFLVACVLLISEFKRKIKWKLAGIYVGLTGVIWFLWEAHIKMVYNNANASRHSMSLGYMKSVFLSKPVEELQKIVGNFIKIWFSFNESYEWPVIVGFLSVIILANIVNRKSRRLFYGPLLVGAFYLVYKVCLIGMYLTNMPGADAVNIGGYGRYQYTFTVIMLFAALWYYLTFVQGKILGQRYLKIITPLMVAGFMISTYSFTAYARPDYKYGGIHRRLVTLINDGVEGIGYGDKVLIYDGYEFSFFFVQFTFRNEGCNATCDLEVVKEVLTENKNQYDYFVVMTKDEQITELLKNYGYAENIECVELIY